MARSFYKGPWIGKQPMCAICGGAGSGGRQRFFLTRGVSVWLCAAHRSQEFQRRRAGRDFVVSLDAVWRSGGRVTRRQAGALDDHLRRVRGRRADTDLPGSYAWPRLRVEAEARFAAGEDPVRVIADLQGRCDGLAVNGPTWRTLRRWFTEGRWLRWRTPDAAPTIAPRIDERMDTHPAPDGAAAPGTRPVRLHRRE